MLGRKILPTFSYHNGGQGSGAYPKDEIAILRPKGMHDSLKAGRSHGSGGSISERRIWSGRGKLAHRAMKESKCSAACKCLK